jgi:hypothetical protein
MQYLIYAVIASGIVSGGIFPQMQSAKDSVPYLIGLVLFLNFSEVSVPWRRFYRRMAVPVSEVTSFSATGDECETKARRILFRCPRR